MIVLYSVATFLTLAAIVCGVVAGQLMERYRNNSSERRPAVVWFLIGVTLSFMASMCVKTAMKMECLAW